MRALAWAAPAAFLLCVTLPHLDQGDFRTDTGWYAAIALQAWRTGEWWTLYAEPGLAYFNKPPLVFWIHGLFLHVLGVSLWAARLPSVLAAAGCVLCTAGIVREFAWRRAAMTCGIVLALTYEFFRRTREISLDLWQLLFMLAAAWMAARAVRRDRWGLAVASGVPLGLALLCKPLAALLCGVVLAAWGIRAGTGVRVRAGQVSAVGVACAVAAPWHVSMLTRHGDAFRDQYFGREIADRAAGALIEATGAGSGLWYYPREIAGTYWPWMVPLVLAAAWCVRGRWFTRDRGLEWLAIAWSVAWLAALLWFADKRPRYAVVLYPMWAVLAGLWLSRWRWGGGRSFTRLMARWGLPVAVAAAVVVAATPVRLQRPPDAHWAALSAWLGAASAEDRANLWQGAFEPWRGARVYLETGRWPTPTRDHRGNRIAEPPAGALLIYHDDERPGPGANEVVVFQHAPIRITRLGEGGWRPE